MKVADITPNTVKAKRRLGHGGDVRVRDRRGPRRTPDRAWSIVEVDYSIEVDVAGRPAKVRDQPRKALSMPM